MNDEEYEWECLVCGCSDLDPTGEFFEGKQIYCCPDCGNKQQKKYTSNISAENGKEEIYKRIE